MSTSAVLLVKALITSLTDLKDDFAAAGEALGTAFIGGVKDAIEAGVGEVVAAVQSLFNEDGIGASSILDTAKATGNKIGEALTYGIADGLVAPGAINAIADKIVELIAEIQKKAEEAAGIQSPSTLFRDKIGKNITLGIAVGIDEGSDDLTESVQIMMDRVYGVARDGIGGTFVSGIIQGIRGEQTSLNSTIVSLLDQSVTTAKTALDINSPSKVTENMIGAPYVDGIRVALENGRDRLSGVAGSLLSSLPDGKEFNYSVNGLVNEQPIDLKYSNLLTSLPTLSQQVQLQQQGMMKQSSMMQSVNAIAHPYQTMQNSMAQQISTMNNSNRSSVSNSNVYHYEMHVQTTPDRAVKVGRNFDAMRLSRRV